MQLTKDGVCSLRICKATSDDIGHYTCCATNLAGRETCSGELFVEGFKGIDQTSYIDPETLKRIMAGCVNILPIFVWFVQIIH